MVEDWQRACREAVDRKMAFINQHRERLIEAWIAETGLLPSDAVLCTRDKGDTIELWVMSKEDAKAYPPVPDYGDD